MLPPEFLKSLGIEPSNAVAGLSGGVLNIFSSRTTSPFDAAGALLAGTLTANYLGSPVAEALHTPPLATAFLVGFGGLKVMAIMMAALRGRLARIGGSNGEEPNA